MHCLNCAKITLILFLLYSLAITQSSAAESSTVVEINKIQLSLRLQPFDSGKKVVRDPKAFNQLGNQEFPDMIDKRVLVPAPDGTFIYSGPMTYQYGNGKRIQLLPLTTQTRRRLTADVQARIIYRNPEYLKPEYKTTDGPELYAAGEELTHDAYKQFTGKR